PWRSAAPYGSVGCALVAESTMMTPKTVSSVAVEAISTYSVEGGLNSFPSETRAARPRCSVRGGRAVCVISAPPFHPVAHRTGEALSPVRVTGELVEGCRRRGQQDRPLAVDHPRRQFHHAVHDLSSVASDHLDDGHGRRVSSEGPEHRLAIGADDQRAAGRAA